MMMSTPLNFALRRATINDSDALFVWRNHPTIRQFSANPHPIDWATHQRWLTETLANQRRILLIGERGQEQHTLPVGVLRYDIAASGVEAIVSIYLAPECMGYGYGVPLLNLGSQWLKEELSFLQRVRADVHPDNTASRKTFERAGYTLFAAPADCEEFAHYELVI
jgi:RimJ/RimL family protein N-acetyltransferase